MSRLHRVSDWIVGRALAILVVGAAITLFFALQLRHLELDPSAESVMLQDDPARQYYERIKDVFGTDRMIAIALHRPDDTVFRPSTLKKLARMTTAIEAISGVERVSSLCNVDNLANCKTGLKPGPLYTAVPTTAAELEELRRQALANDTFVGNLISPDAQTTGIIVFVKTRQVNRRALGAQIRAALSAGEPLSASVLHDAFASSAFAEAVWGRMLAPERRDAGSLSAAMERAPERVGAVAAQLLRDEPAQLRALLRDAPPASRRRLANLVDQIDAIARAHADEPGDEIYAVGSPVMKVQGTRHQRRDLRRLLPCTIVVVALVLFLAFRSAVGVVIPLGTVLVSVVWTFGLMALLGVPLTVITLIIGPLLIAVGNCYAMHIVAHYYEAAGRPTGRLELAARALESCFLPVLLAGLTTVVGFLSVAISRLPSIREFGVFSSFGILCSLFASLTIAPCVLRYLPVPARPSPDARGQRTRHATLIDRFLHAVGRFDAEQGRLITVLGVAAVGAALLGCAFIRVNTNYAGFFRPGDPVRVNARRMHRELAGATPLSIVVDARNAPVARTSDDDEWRGPFTDPKLLAFLLDIERFLGTLRVADGPDAAPGIDKAVSIADQIQLMFHSFSGDTARELPETRAAVEELLDFFYKREDAEKYVSQDFAQANIYVRTHHTSSRVLADLVSRIETYTDAHRPEGVRVAVTGETILITRAADEIALGQVRSLAIAVAVIFTLMAILFTSAKAGLLSIVPNAIPIVGTLGLMGWLGVDLNAGTSLVATVALGIAVDDTIHYMTGFNQEVRRLGDQTRAMLLTLYLRGKAITFTSVALCLGFLVLAASQFAPNAAFGYLTAIAMVTALLGDLVVLPVLMRHVELVTLWDLLVTRLPSDPAEWRGVLRGLTPAEARRLVLVCRHRRVPSGARVLIRGADPAAARPVWADEGLGRTLYAVLEGRLGVRAGPDDRHVATIGPGQLFGEASPVHGPQPPNVVALDRSDLLVIDERALQRLSRRYPRVAGRVLRNLVFLLADRLFQATTRLRPTDGPAPPSSAAPFAGLSQVEGLAIRILAEARTLKAGDVLERAAGRREMFLFLSGSAVLTPPGEPDGAPAIRVGEGDVLGGGPPGPELADDAPPLQPFGVRAEVDSQVLVVTEAMFGGLVASRPRLASRWGLSLVRILSRRLEDTVGRIDAADRAAPRD